MSPLDLAKAEELASQRQLMRRAFGQGRRWYLRAVLLLLVAGFGFARGGQLNVFIGAIMLILAVLSGSLGRTMRNNARAMKAKIKLMEAM